jgi:Fe-Mn family superoxide dismutase
VANLLIARRGRFCTTGTPNKEIDNMSDIKLPPLPYAQDALEPHMSAKTIGFHYGKHHQTYVNTLNTLIKGTAFEGKSLEEIIKASAGKAEHAKIFNNAAQVWNHTFFWEGMKPGGGGAPGASLAKEIDQAFGSLDKFKEAFKTAAVGQFGSGWAWLVEEGGKLKITSTGNADLPMVHGQNALFTCDVWEHAYYLDYQNVRPDFVAKVLDHLIDWDAVAKRLAASKRLAA